MADREVLDQIHFGFLHPYKVAGMGEPWVQKMADTHRLLKAKGIGAILTLTEDDLYGDLHRSAGFLCHHEPIDDTEPPTREGMRRALDFMDACLEKGQGVAAHCMEGRGRTGTILCAWVGLKESLAPQEAMIRIHELRAYTVLTPTQRSFLLEYL
ncbi:MAG: dual specificity protein phosphatase family protein [Desulfobacterales bacterium]